MKYKEVKYGKRGRYGSEIKILADWVPNEIGNMAVEMTRHIAIACGIEDGEDSSGRAKLRLLPAAEVAKRACDIADALTKELRERGWVLDLPESAMPVEEDESEIKPSEPLPPEK